MKKIILISLLCLWLVDGIAQSAVKFQIGYAVPILNDLINTTKPASSGYPDSEAIGSYGAGMRFEFGYIQTFSDLIDVEINVAYLSGKKIESQNFNFSTDFPTGYANSWQVSPMMRFKINSTTKLTPYFGFGPLFASGKIFYEYNPNQIDPKVPSVAITKEDSYNFNVGVKSIIGISYSLGKLNAFMELGFINLTVSPDKSDFTKWDLIQNGVTTSNLENISVNEKNIVYKDKIGPVTIDHSGIDVYGNNERLRYYSPLSSLNISVGLAYNFSSKNQREN